MEAMEEKRQLKLEKAREYYRNKKATDEAFVKRHNEEARKRHERMRADPAYVAKCRENSRAQYKRSKEAGTLMTYRKLCERDVEKYGYEKRKEDAVQYYMKRCEDPEFRVKMAERKKVQYRERKIKECGSEVLYEMCRPGRPRKYQAPAALEMYRISTPSTTANNSTHGSGDEQ